jgi:hypothetical protein
VKIRIQFCILNSMFPGLCGNSDPSVFKSIQSLIRRPKTIFHFFEIALNQASNSFPFPSL